MKTAGRIRRWLHGAAGLAFIGGVISVNAFGATPEEVLAASAPAREEMVAGFIVKPSRRANDDKLEAALGRKDARSLSNIAKIKMAVARRMSNDSHVLRMDQPIPLSEARVIAARMMRQGGIELAEPDRIIYPTAVTPQDPAYAGQQWHYQTPSGSNFGGINLPVAWDFSLGNYVTVAVLDTGYRPHEDLKAVLPGYDFVTNQTTANDGDGRDADARDPGDWVTASECESASDSSWHGTHVMGTIAALMNNGKGGTGVAPNAKILPVRVLGKCGGRTSDIVDAMRWAAGIDVPDVPRNLNPARVLNISLGASGACSAAFQSAVNDVVNAGKVIVASAGNSNSPAPVSQPGNCAGVLTVTAHAINGDKASYANFGPEVFISAPGGGCGTVLGGSCGNSIFSTWNSGARQPGSDAYAYMNGTSMAAPHVAGTIALMLSIRPNLSLEEIKSYLQATARPHPVGGACQQAGYINKCGAGLLDAGAALTKLATGSAQPTAVISNASQIKAPGTAVTLSGTAYVSGNATIANANQQALSYQWRPSPGNPGPVTLIDANKSEASFIAPEKGGVYVFILEVSDGSGNIGKAAAIVRINNPPQLASLEGQTVQVGQPLQFQLSGTDADGDSMIFHSLSLPEGASLSPEGVFVWPAATTAGTYEVSYYASDYYEDGAVGKTTVTVSTPLQGGGGGGGGGGGMDDWSLIALLLMAFYFRFRRAGQAKARP